MIMFGHMLQCVSISQVYCGDNKKLVESEAITADLPVCNMPLLLTYCE